MLLRKSPLLRLKPFKREKKNLTVARSALVAWSRLKPIETMVARCSSDRLSVGVVPGPELQPGNTKGAEKSAANQK